MKNEELVALTKLVNDDERKEASGGMEPGVYPVDVTIRVHGVLKKGEPYKQTVVAKLQPWKLLLIALNKLNDATLDTIVKTALDDKTDDETMEGFKKKVNEAAAKLTASTKVECSGRVTGAVVFERVETTVVTVDVPTKSEKIYPVIKGL